MFEVGFRSPCTRVPPEGVCTGENLGERFDRAQRADSPGGTRNDFSDKPLVRLGV